MNNEKECAVYLQTQKAYHRAMEEMRKKWRSYGKAAGRITLKRTSEEERRAVSGITGKRYLSDTRRNRTRVDRSTMAFCHAFRKKIWLADCDAGI